MLIFTTSNTYSLRTDITAPEVLPTEPTTTPAFVIPDSMKDNPTKEDTITFPDPKKSAFQLSNLFYDMKTYKCEAGMLLGDSVKKLAMDFQATVKPTNKSTPEQVIINHKELKASLQAIMNTFDEMEKTNCAAFLKSEILRWRRVAFLFQLR